MEGWEGLGRVPHKGAFTSLGTERPTGFGGTGSKKGEGRVEPKRASNPPLFRFRVNPVSGIRVGCTVRALLFGLEGNPQNLLETLCAPPR